MGLYDFSATLNNGKEKKLSAYKGKVLLIVNTASKCGFTPQYEGLQKLYAQVSRSGASTCSPSLATSSDTRSPAPTPRSSRSARLNYGVEFPLFSKIDVNGSDEHPLYKFLKSEKGGLIGDSIKWNFTKFLVDKQGNVIERYAPTTPPERIGTRH